MYAAEQAETRLEPGDMLVVFTDGLHEAESPEKEWYGEDRLVRFIVDHCHLDVTALADAVVEDVLGHIGSSEQQDDMTQLIVKRLA
jgi:sigma-B regulation protein RsbU (phosphoserine phosphatase)